MSESSKPWLLYGANGYTGKLIAREAVERGVRPVLAGRNRAEIEALAAELGCESKIFSLDDPAQVKSQLSDHPLVLNCAGPFTLTAPAMMEACLAVGIHYLDITGEIPVIEHAAALGKQAEQAGVALIPAVGFDVVPTDCLAATLAAQLPGATHLVLAMTSLQQLSPGTARTIVEHAADGGHVRRDGKIERVPTAWKTREIPFLDRRRQAFTIPWGDVASAYHSTGIPNIEVYAGATRRQIAWLRRTRPLVGLLRIGLLKRFVQRQIKARVPGPSERSRQSNRSIFWGQVSDASGRSVEGHLTAPDGYALTVLTALAAVEHVLSEGIGAGFFTPSKAFGKDFIRQIPGCEYVAAAQPPEAGQSDGARPTK